MPINDVLPFCCPEDEKRVVGPPIQQFLRLTQQCVDQTRTDDLKCRVFEAQPMDPSVIRVKNAGGIDVAANPAATEDESLHEGGLTFKNLWEPAELSALRDNMRYDGQEKLIQSALIEGWTESECIRQGIKNAMSAYAINARHELEIHDPTVGWAVVIPAQRSDLFRKIARWLHECNHPSESQQYRQIRRRFYWHSPSKMRAEISSVHSECVSCTLRKRSTRKPAHISAPIDVGHRPFSVISVDPKDMPLDPVTGYNNMICVCDRFTGYTIAIPNYRTDTAADIAKLLVHYVYSIFGVPSIFLSDNDQKFASHLFKEVHRELGCSVSLGTPYHHKSSGGIEIRIGALMDTLNLLNNKHQEQGEQWYSNLPRAVYEMNQKENPLTGISAAELLFGYRPVSPIDLLADPHNKDEDLDHATRLEAFFGDDNAAEREGRLEEYLQKRDDDRQQHADRRRSDRAAQESKSRDKAASIPDFQVGGYVCLHHQAFGNHQKRLPKLQRKQSYGPYRILELDMKNARVRVELGGDFTKGKTNWFSLEHVRRYWLQRPFEYDAISLETRMQAPEMGAGEYEVGEVVQRKVLHGHYKYELSYKGWDESTKLLKRSHDDFKQCQSLLDEFDAAHPFGSLRGDQPSDCRKFEDRLKNRPRQRQRRLAAWTCRATAAKTCSSGVSCGMPHVRASESAGNQSEGLRLLACEHFGVRRMAVGRLPGSAMLRIMKNSQQQIWWECPHGAVRVRGTDARPHGYFMDRHETIATPRCELAACVKKFCSSYDGMAAQLGDDYVAEKKLGNRRLPGR